MPGVASAIGPDLCGAGLEFVTRNLILHTERWRYWNSAAT